MIRVLRPHNATLEQQLERTNALPPELGRILSSVFHRDGAPIRSFRRTWLTACRRAGVPRSGAIEIVGHRTESISRRYAIADDSMLGDAGARLAVLHGAGGAGSGQSPRVEMPAKREAR